MRSGQYQRKAPGPSNAGPTTTSQAAQKNAETLFETRLVAEIRQIEARTRSEIDEKKEELRQLVGNSYRDLIESADKIVDMKNTCCAVVGHVGEMQAGFAELNSRAQNFVTQHTQNSGRSKSEIDRDSRKKLFAAGSRVKYLVDTPEKIWGCLDDSAFLKATERYLRACEVHEILTASPSEDQENDDQNIGRMDFSELLSSFPLLSHHWPQVKAFKDQIIRLSGEGLRSESSGALQCAVCLSSIALIKEAQSKDLLQMFLDARTELVKEFLERAKKLVAETNVAEESGGLANTLGNALSEVVKLLQRTICEAGELFKCAVPGDEPLFFATLKEGSKDDSLFGGIPYPEVETAAWDARMSRLSTVLPLVSDEVITDACQKWLTAMNKEVAAYGRELLGGVG
eukprot:CAMPEP_0118935450 /NCGR_PEP_ID=MMETSP1169-20130426/15650_1 /TAXON_ID=36882 /ORGANISM="Pyramimonas obovata, Strain CCMP722" /LENGTH=399 /DNA_ID=CAMNT_0006878493 /DNA_START=206 /DNA_END=1401 /DNA_ORIENTATION=+